MSRYNLRSSGAQVMTLGHRLGDTPKVESSSDSDAPLNIRKYSTRRTRRHPPPTKIPMEEQMANINPEKDPKENSNKPRNLLVRSSSGFNPFQHTIKVFVGKGAKEYQLHPSLLREKSERLKKCLVYDLSNGQQAITLADVDPHGFHKFVEWVYGGISSIDLEGKRTRDDKDNKVENDKGKIATMYTELDSLFDTGKRLDAPMLLKDIRNGLISLWSRSALSVDEMTSCIYAGTHKGSPIRELWVSVIVFRNSDVQCTDVDFLLDLVAKQRSILQNALPSQGLDHSSMNKPKASPVEERILEPTPAAMPQKFNKGGGHERTAVKRQRSFGEQQVQDGGIPEPPSAKVQITDEETTGIAVKCSRSSGKRRKSLLQLPLPKAQVPKGVEELNVTKRRKSNDAEPDDEEECSKGGDEYHGLLDRFLKSTPS